MERPDRRCCNESQSELEILEGCLRGEDQAWSKFHEINRPRIRKTVLFTIAECGCKVDSDTSDMIQEVLSRLAKNNYKLLSTYDSKQSCFTTWLSYISRAVCIDYLRHNRFDTIPLDEEHYSTPDIPRFSLSDIAADLLSPREIYVVKAYRTSPLHCFR